MGTPGIAVRTAERADLDAVIALWRQLEEVQGPARVYPLPPDVEDEMRARFTDAIDDPDARLLLAMSDGRAVGMALARAGGNWGTPIVDLSKVVVDEGQRRSGVGEALVAAAESFARERGARFLEAKVFAGNDGARTFWERIGFGPRYEAVVRRVSPEP